MCSGLGKLVTLAKNNELYFRSIVAYSVYILHTCSVSMNRNGIACNTERKKKPNCMYKYEMYIKKGCDCLRISLDCH